MPVAHFGCAVPVPAGETVHAGHGKQLFTPRIPPQTATTTHCCNDVFIVLFHLCPFWNSAAGTRLSSRLQPHTAGLHHPGDTPQTLAPVCTGECRPPQLANKDTNFSAFLFSGEQDGEQTGEVKATERSQGHLNLKKNTHTKTKKKPELSKQTFAGTTGGGTNRWGGGIAARICAFK